MDALADIVVVGCGGDGLSCALSYAEAARAQGRTAKVLILEVAPEAERGGATAWTTAGFRIDANEQFDPLWVGRVEEVSRGLADTAYCRKLESEIPNTIANLREIGIELQHRSIPLRSVRRPAM